MSFPSFPEFFRAANGMDPFPWQERLAEHVATRQWPAEIGIPTGLGKTSCIDIAVWNLASQAELHPTERTAPTRIWYVVNRRLLVDAASTHATRLAERLSEAQRADGDTVLQKVATALARISPTGESGEPLFVSRLRGGGRPGIRPPHPAQPSIICSTVPMFGSRLLFRGFGASNRMWPIDAALAGTDALVLLDEAHLSRPLQELVDRLPKVDATAAGIPIQHGFLGAENASILPKARSRPRLVSLTATGNGKDPFVLGPADMSHPIVLQRIHARKDGFLAEVKTKALPRELAERTLTHLRDSEESTTAIVFVNSPSTARDTEKALHAGLRQRQYRDMKVEILTLTGRLRDVDAHLIRDKLLDPASGVVSGSAPRGSEQPHLVVVATQTLEVGADLDFQFLASEMAGVRAVTQRLGRLNRLGTYERSEAHLLWVGDLKKPGIYGNEPAALYERLQRIPRRSGDSSEPALDLSPAEVSETLGAPADMPVFMPELLPAHMWEFAKTSNPPAGAAPPEVFFSGVESPYLTVSVCWRNDLPPAGEAILPRVRTTELSDVPIAMARSYFESEGRSPLALSDDGTLHRVTPDELRPGTIIVMHTSEGCYGPTGWDPDSRQPVHDVSLAATAQMVVTRESVSNLLGGDLDDETSAVVEALEFDPEEGPDPGLDKQLATDLATLIMEHLGRSGLRQWVVNRDPAKARIERIYTELRPLLVWPEEAQPVLSDARFDALDELSIAPTVDLPVHLEAVAEMAHRIAEQLGFPDSLVAAVRSGAAFHDLGKADRRFQLLLGNVDGAPVAKSDTTVARWSRSQLAAPWPRGGRHEAVSLQFLEANPGLLDGASDPNLVKHLVASHHGHARPLVPAPGQAGTMTTRFRARGAPIEAQTTPSHTDWSQPDRFAELCQRYGYWGLALLEASVRQADHVVSQVTEVS